MIERIAKIISQTNEIFLKQWLHFADVVVITFAPYYFLNIFVFQNETILEKIASVISVNGVTVLYACFKVDAILWFFYGSLVIFILADKIAKNKPATAFEAYRKALEYFIPVFCVKIICLFRILLWSLLLVLPGIYFALLYSMAGQIKIFGSKEGDVFKQSKDMVTPQLKFVVVALLFGAVYIGGFAYIVKRFFEAVYYSLYFVVKNVIAARVVEGLTLCVLVLFVSYALVYFYALFKNVESGEYRSTVR